MKILTMDELEEVSGGQLTCGDKWEIAGGVVGAIAGGLGGAVVGIGAGDFASYVFC